MTLLRGGRGGGGRAHRVVDTEGQKHRLNGYFLIQSIRDPEILGLVDAQTTETTSAGKRASTQTLEQDREIKQKRSEETWPDKTGRIFREKAGRPRSRARSQPGDYGHSCVSCARNSRPPAPKPLHYNYNGNIKHQIAIVAFIHIFFFFFESCHSTTPIPYSYACPSKATQHIDVRVRFRTGKHPSFAAHPHLHTSPLANWPPTHWVPPGFLLQPSAGRKSKLALASLNSQAAATW
ncbi:hypothetical protein LX36DRAFT_99995 [Colletotrichum falcatum]|nr:hypothetical protein LX36DRAFT_99995 [Colletotrichum falcatum]